MNYENVVVEKDGAVGIITLNRPQQLNALSYDLVKELAVAVEALDQDADGGGGVEPITRHPCMAQGLLE